MQRQRLLWKIFTSFLWVNVISLVVLTWFATFTIRHFQLDQTRSNLVNAGQLLLPTLKPALQDRTLLSQLVKAWRNDEALRVTVIDPKGLVLADNHFEPSMMENHSDRPELMKARKNQIASSVRFSSTAQQRNIYVAIPINENGQVAGYLRLSRSMAGVDALVRGFQFRILIGWLILSFITGYFILRVSRKISRPLEHFRSSLQRYAFEETGIFHPEEPKDFPREIEQLAQVMDLMATRLDERTMSLVNQRHEEEVILASMNEAVLAVDDQARIIRLNTSAARLFQLNPESSRGKKFQELVRNDNLNKFLRQVLESLEPKIAEIKLFKPDPIYLEAHGSRLRNANGDLLGAVIVLNDVTRLKNLENLRRDFVGNVTHELRTPITSIKGFIETLLDGENHDPNDVQRFLNIISRQADRLNHIIDDLLSLSKIEQRNESTNLELEHQNLRKVLESALWSIRDRAEEKQIMLVLHCHQDLEADLHASLFEQAITNLVDNAVKYSEPNKTVAVRAEKIEDALQIQVEDQGHGIPASHLSRLFERFYRVDKGRSRAMGGTGLGLSIVKHIVAAHHGRIEVTSEVGKGSIFTIRLPLVPNIESPRHSGRGLLVGNG